LKFKAGPSHILDQSIQILINSLASELKGNLETSFIENIYKSGLNKVGVLCLSQCYDDILMWSHYSKDHTGIVLGFDEENLFSGYSNSWSDPVCINYHSEFKKICSLKLTPLDVVKEVCTRKSSHWSYEKEVRFIAYKEDGLSLNELKFYIGRKIQQELSRIDSSLLNEEPLKIYDEFFTSLSHASSIKEVINESEYSYRLLMIHIWSEILKLSIGNDKLNFGGTTQKFKKESLREVIFGCCVSNKDIINYAKFIDDLEYKNIKLYQMKVNEKSFKLDRSEINVSGTHVFEL